MRAGLYLLGFKPRNCLRPWHTWRQSTFVYPDEQGLPGSTTAFIAVHQAMLDDDRCASFGVLHQLAEAYVYLVEYVSAVHGGPASKAVAGVLCYYGLTSISCMCC